MNKQGPLFYYEVGKKTWLNKDGNWWHVFNFKVQDGCVALQEVDPIVYCQKRPITEQKRPTDTDICALQEVDSIVMGYPSVPSRTMVPPGPPGRPVTSLSRTSMVTVEENIYCWSKEDSKFEFMLKFFPHVLSIDGDRTDPRATATFALYDAGKIIVKPGTSLKEASEKGLDLPPGEYQIVISASMFVDLGQSFLKRPLCSGFV